MIGDIVVHIPVDRSPKSVIEYAVSMGSLFGAHLEGIACVYQILDPVVAFEASAVGAASRYDTHVEEVASALDQFETAAKRSAMKYGARSVCNVSYAATRT